jgi:DNA-binding NarL/FixJ family response regulator
VAEPASLQRTGALALRVLVVDDDPAARRALREAVGRAPEMILAAEAASAAEGMAAAGDVDPDVVVIDAETPDLDGLTATLRMTRRYPGLPVLILASRPNDHLAVLALRAGAAGFLTKDVSPEAIVRAARGLTEGEAAISRRLTRRLVYELRALSRGRRRLRPVQSELTPREWQVLDLLAEGVSTAEMAARLGLSVGTVRGHVKHLLRKLDVHTRADAVEAGERLRASANEAPEEDDRPAVDERELRRCLRSLGTQRMGHEIPHHQGTPAR